ncbi:MAG: SCP-2 sterol transfer family protein [Thiothrix sp.]
MPQLFSAEWMNQLKDLWNADPDIKDKLAAIGFSSIITCGIKGEDKPMGVFVVENGECVRAGDYAGEKPDWDMRASRADWLKWTKEPLGMVGLGTAYTFGKLKFVVGDYAAMIKNPAMAGPFVKSFGLMAKIPTE